ncbi:MAG: MOSC domain-containing protein [Candidatus Zixiibacteriota bacterium]|nr:MAG: MOSC domain-containing protein [candidate division Zixibacteria bacterium]
MPSHGRIHRISISAEKGTKKQNVPSAELRADFGIVGDAHAGSGRQVSLLPLESFDLIRKKLSDIQPGDFAENLTITGVELQKARVGTRLVIGDRVELVVTQIGKECHHGCYIREIVGDCIMPREGVFASVVTGGRITVGDSITMIEQ